MAYAKGLVSRAIQDAADWRVGNGPGPIDVCGWSSPVIAKGRVSYEPNTLGNGSEFRVDGGEQGFQTYAEEIESPKVRRRSPSFDDHFAQALDGMSAPGQSLTPNLLGAAADAME